MEWKAVEDKKIAEVGFGDGYYGPQTLGLKFKPWKTEHPVTEYHYANITGNHHDALLSAADDTGKGISNFFDAKIRKFPNLYPYQKIDPGKTYTPTLF